ncbi:MAG: response regulator [Chitinivibrionales bacterium]|nr:response regulator [Chitinivibrionales bacterium]
MPEESHFNPHLLIVDDERSICDILSQYLNKVGYTTSVARSGDEAVRILEANSIDMVLTDIKMPGMSGVDLLKWIKENKNALPVLLTTGFPTLDTAIEALKLGAYDYLTKPFHLEEIGEKIKRALANKELQEENIVFSNLVSLHEVTKELASTHDIHELHLKILDYCVKLSKADGGSLMFFDSKSRLTVFETLGESTRKEFWEDTLFSNGARSTVDRNEPIILPDESNSNLPDSVECYMAFPLSTSKKMLGVLNLVRKKGRAHFSNLDFEIIKVLAPQASISIENVRLYQNIRDNYLKTIRGFALAVEAKDRYTHGHSENVMKYTIVLARKLGLSPAEIERAKYAGLLHDVGKIGVSELILNKPGRLSLPEFEEIKKHPELGARIIEDVPFLKSLVPLVLHHHEFYNGSGYPGGLDGENIPYGARILCVCDAFEAMTSDRPYRKAMTIEKAAGILNENKGEQFDPAIVEAFLAMLKSDFKRDEP